MWPGVVMAARMRRTAAGVGPVRQRTTRGRVTSSSSATSSVPGDGGQPAGSSATAPASASSGTVKPPVTRDSTGSTRVPAAARRASRRSVYGVPGGLQVRSRSPSRSASAGRARRRRAGGRPGRERGGVGRRAALSIPGPPRPRGRGPARRRRAPSSSRAISPGGPRASRRRARARHRAAHARLVAIQRPDGRRDADADRAREPAADFAGVREGVAPPPRARSRPSSSSAAPAGVSRTSRVVRSSSSTPSSRSSWRTDFETACWARCRRARGAREVQLLGDRDERRAAGAAQACAPPTTGGVK